MADEDISMNKEELLQRLKKMAAEWRASPHISNDYSEGLRYNELRQLLREKFDCRLKIESDAQNQNTNYQVMPEDEEPDNRESIQRYSTAKEYVMAINIVRHNPSYTNDHETNTRRPTHLLLGFALELYLKAWLLADSVSSDKVRQYKHKLLDLHGAAVSRGFPSDKDIEVLVSHMAAPHGQDGDYVYRYTDGNDDVPGVKWHIAWPIIEKLDMIVDEHVGASATYGHEPGHWFPR